jgi:hypothetical protein
MPGQAYQCPICKRRFARKPAEHTCARYEIGPLLEGKQPHVLAMYKRVIALAKACGPLQVSALKTTIALAAPAVMANITPQKAKLKVTLVLPGARLHPAVRSRYELSVLKCSHEFSFATETELDGAFEELVREAWSLASGKEPRPRTR